MSQEKFKELLIEDFARNYNIPTAFSHKELLRLLKIFPQRKVFVLIDNPEREKMNKLITEFRGV